MCPSKLFFPDFWGFLFFTDKISKFPDLEKISNFPDFSSPLATLEKSKWHIMYLSVSLAWRAFKDTHWFLILKKCLQHFSSLFWNSSTRFPIVPLSLSLTVIVTVFVESFSLGRSILFVFHFYHCVVWPPSNSSTGTLRALHELQSLYMQSLLISSQTIRFVLSCRSAVAITDSCFSLAALNRMFSCRLHWADDLLILDSGWLLLFDAFV